VNGLGNPKLRGVLQELMLPTKHDRRQRKTCNVVYDNDALISTTLIHARPRGASRLTQ
jgi:hypothetical protein